ncbi:hypothetical protein OTU49_008193 [Cherax quadricarinatus]|uniref:Solute carrier family 25 member 51 n=1 Tax=Cherax quadricarinatus TaxID=27406 RepID=A0AAW0WSB8_CHEQU
MAYRHHWALFYQLKSQLSQCQICQAVPRLHHWPLTVTMMLHGISTANAMTQLKREGLKNLYRGILPPLCQKTISTSIMFGMFDQYGKLLRYYHPQLSDGTTMALAATLAGCTEAILCPFERIQTVLQDKKFHGKYKNSLHIAQDLWKFGVREYYRGMVSILLRNGPSNILFFGLRTDIKERLPDPGQAWWGHIITDFVSGAFLGAFISTVMYPINVIKAHQQCQVGGPFQTMRGTFWHIYHARGSRFSRLFSGAHVNYTRALVSWGIINASYEMLHKLFYS